MLTQKDLNEIEKLVDNKLDEKLKFLPSKDEFYERMDKLIGEVKAMRETQEIHSGSHSDISDRLEKLEKSISP